MLLRPANGNRFKPNPVQAIITSYKFNCSGVITKWRALVEGSSIGAFEEQIYTISFQVWRPSSLSTVDTDGCYNLTGFNNFSPIPLAHPDTPERGIVTGVPLESERIEFQPGDVVGFYLEGSRTSLDSIQFAGDEDNLSPYTEETVWFATGSLIPRPEATCMYPVGTSGLLNSSTNLAPLISVGKQCYRIAGNFRWCKFLYELPIQKIFRIKIFFTAQHSDVELLCKEHFVFR